MTLNTAGNTGSSLSLARIMHKFSTAATKSSDLPALHSVGLLQRTAESTFAGASRRGPCQVGAFVASLQEPMHIPG